MSTDDRIRRLEQDAEQLDDDARQLEARETERQRRTGNVSMFNMIRALCAKDDANDLRKQADHLKKRESR